MTRIVVAGIVVAVTVGAWNGGQFFNGDLDEVMIFNRALTALERTALYEWTG